MRDNENRRFVELEWICPNCDGVNKGSKKTCAQCGAPQPENVKFQRARDEKIVADSAQIAAASAGADIHCGFCGTRNPASAQTCSQCGGDLKEGKARAAGQILQAAPPAPKVLTCSNCGTENSGAETLCSKCGAPLKRAEPAPAQMTAASGGAENLHAPTKKTNWLLIGGVIAGILLCCILALTLFILPAKSVDGTVNRTEWQTSVPVEEIQPQRYTDKSGSPPASAYDVSCRTESREICEDKTVDKGNGFAEVVTECRTENTDYCDYTLDEWTTIQTYTLSGADLFPQYAEPTLYDKQRLGNSSEDLIVYFDTANGEETYKPSSVTEFQQFERGSVWVLQMNSLGGILSVERK
ncbi:MAG: hypothetical protein Fur002_03270 [Anaerolineales bacterium]